jgi:uncharacterized protein (TIGR02679 family)
VAAGVVRVRLAVLDDALRRSAAAAGLVSVIGELTGSPLVDRAADRDASRETWGEVWTRLDAGLAAAGLADAPWVPLFADGLRRSGALTRAGVDAAGLAVDQAVRALMTLDPLSMTPAPPEPSWELGALAVRCTGSSHGLDDGRLTGVIVLRAAAAALQSPVPETAAARRELWVRIGVAPDQVSGTVLAWGLRPPGRSRWAAMLRERADLGLVSHLTVHELWTFGAVPPVEAGTAVFACENPQVLQAAVRAGVASPLLCFAGNPASAGWLMMHRLVEAGAVVRYHGDFDWPGVAIAGRLYAAGAQLWRMGARDYDDGVDGLPADARLELTGTPVPTPWDPDLARRMDRCGVAVHEEALLDVLLPDLTGTPAGRRPPASA